MPRPRVEEVDTTSHVRERFRTVLARLTCTLAANVFAPVAARIAQAEIERRGCFRPASRPWAHVLE